LSIDLAKTAVGLSIVLSAIYIYTIYFLSGLILGINILISTSLLKLT